MLLETKTFIEKFKLIKENGEPVDTYVDWDINSSWISGVQWTIAEENIMMN